MEILGIIPARAGSKGISCKNLQPLANKTLLAWTCEAAIQAFSLSRVIVSTEDAQISEEARRSGVEVPFMRPPELAGDASSAQDVVSHALEWLRIHENWQPQCFMLLQPTSPLRTSEDIEQAIALFKAKKATSVVSVCLSVHPPEWAMRIDEQGRLFQWRKNRDLVNRRQDALPTFQLNGAIYLTKSQDFLKSQTFYSDSTYAYIMPSERSIDIDNPWDLYLANLVLYDRFGKMKSQFY